MNRSLWVVANTVGWAAGMAAGLALGFVFPIVGDIFAVIVFMILLSLVSVQLLDVDTKGFLRETWTGLLVGLVAAFVFVLVADRIIPLGLSHSLSLLLAIAIGSRIQQRALPSGRWWLFSTASQVVGFAVVWVLDVLLDLNLEVLDVRTVDYSAVPEWGLIGAVLGLLYGVFTSWDIQTWEDDS